MSKQIAYINMSLDGINKELDAQTNRSDLPVNAIYVTVSHFSQEFIFFSLCFLKFLFPQETLTEVIPHLNVVRDKLFRTQDEFAKLCDSSYLEHLKEKLCEIINRLAETEKRLHLCTVTVVSFSLVPIMDYFFTLIFNVGNGK